MELRHIRYFTAAAEELNISKAARRLNVSQPAMSRLIRDLEDELATTLFVRERLGLSLTAAGEKLLVYARQILDLSNEAVRVVGRMPDIRRALNIGFIPSSIGSFLSMSIRTFRMTNPGVVVQIHELSPGDQLTALRKRQIDLGLIGNLCGTVHDEFGTRVLFEMSLNVVIPETHHLAGRRRVSLSEFSKEDFIGYREDSFPGRNQTITNACLVAGFKPELNYHADSLVEVLAMVSSGSGICLMPSDVASLAPPDVVFIPVEENLAPIKFAAAWRRDDDRVELQKLLDCLKKPK